MTFEGATPCQSKEEGQATERRAPSRQLSLPVTSSRPRDNCSQKPQGENSHCLGDVMVIPDVESFVAEFEG